MTPTQLKKARTRMDLSQSELGDLLGVTSNTVARWERDDMTISHPKILALAMAHLQQKRKS